MNCGHKTASDALRKAHPEIEEFERAQEEFIREFIQHNKAERIDTTMVYTIPVVFHIIHQYGPENISNQNIYDQMAILNRDYRKLNADTSGVISPFQSLIADARIQFKLATIDPFGNCTNGIDRIANTQTFIGNDGSKLNTWPRQKYLNVWIVNNMENGVAGYAYYPSAVQDAFSCWIDGVIIRYNYIGSLSPSSVGTSRALTHEIGHWLELQHTWGNNNDPTVACGDDNVGDTPETKGHDNCQNRYDFFCDNHTLPNVNNPLEGVYTFDNTTPASGVSDTTQTFVENNALNFSHVVANNLSSNSNTTESFGFSNWDLGAGDGELSYSNLTGAINLNKYYEFTLSSNQGQNLSLTGLSLKISRNNTGVRTFAIRSSANNFTSNLPGTISNTALGSIQAGNVFFIKNDDSTTINCGITLNGNPYANLVESAITFRIYAWNAEDANGTFEVDDIQVNGSYGTIENVENYMEYSYCSKMFTKGQQQRMEAALNSPIAYRDQLWSAANLEATGTDGIHDLACAPTADFYCSKKLTCTNNTVQFFDLSSDAEATSWQWTFQDGVPSTSSSQNPSVSFTQPGWKNVTLSVSNSIGTTTMTQNLAVLVTPDWSEVNGLLIETCNTNPLENNYWIELNPNSNVSQWKYTTATGYDGQPGAFYLNETDLENGLWNSRGEDKDELITPSMDLSILSGGTFSFKYAYATQAVLASDITESLEIWSTKNCGETWTLRETISGIDLVTNGAYTAPFVPNQNIQWRDYSFAIPASLETDLVRFKFVFNSSDQSNNLYLDNINISGQVGIDEQGAIKPIALFPNPSNDVINIRIHNNSADKLKQITIYDVSGQLVKIVPVNNITTNAYALDIQDLNEGVYFIQLLMQSGTLNETFVKMNN